MSTIFIPFTLNFGLVGLQVLNVRIVHCVKFVVFFFVQEELKSITIKMAEQSKVLNTPGAEKQTKRELFDALRQELE